MKAKTFEYKGLHFRPIGNILGNWYQKGRYTTITYELKIKDYTHEDFYKVAKKNHASCDIFFCEETKRLYIPINDRLVGIDSNTPIKKCEDYQRWYQ